LLYDNKITGCNNVLLLIVYCSQEFTIYEIGEINDHIQSQAGYGANIIMGVGEDEALDEAIAVTIIATGFNVDQQNDITNTEAKKVVHALEDEQIMEQDLSDKDPAIITPDIILEQKEEKIVHTLEEEVEETTQLPQMDLIPTTDVIKDINVVYDEVLLNVTEEDFIINEVERTNTKAVSDVVEEQTVLSFDLPLTTTPEPKIEEPEEVEKVMFSLDDDIKAVHVNDYVEVITVTEANEEGETRYTLDDHIVLEQTNEKYVAKKDTQVQVEEDIVFEKKVVEEHVAEEEVVEELDPMNSPISDLLKERADERRRKMKDFNYKFNNSKIDDIEKEPAYKRQGVNLDDVQHSSENNASRISIGLDDNDDIQLRSNNSFLHDNVD
jgi:cell division protein FtsZ